MLTNFIPLADEELKRCLLPSPISTAVLAQDAYANMPDEMLRIAIVRRILRFVSPFPWGSPKAEAGGRADSLKRIADALSNTNNMRKFTAGAGVLWTPIAISSDGKLLSLSKSGYRGKVGWLASRQPPIRRPNLGKGSGEQFDSEDSRMTVDITSELASALRRDPSNGLVEILYDCRFLLRIRPHLLPLSVRTALTHTQGCGSDRRCAAGKVFVVPHSQYFLPKLLFRRIDRMPPPEHTRSAQVDGSGHDAINIGDRGDISQVIAQDAELARLLPEGEVAVPRTGEIQTGEDNKAGVRVAGWPFPEHLHQGAFQADFIRLLYS